jgi:hypothetical protein
LQTFVRQDIREGRTDDRDHLASHGVDDRNESVHDVAGIATPAARSSSSNC